MRSRMFAVLLGTICLSLVGYGWLIADEPVSSAGTSKAELQMPVPEYDSEGALLRPVDYEKWIVVGTSVGLSYSDGEKVDPNNPGQFHNVYLQPAAFDHFVETGEFPEQTMFVVTNLPAQSTKKDQERTSVLRNGFFAGRTVGLEVAIKDSSRFPDGWAYYLFRDLPPEKPRDAQQAIADRKACYLCHAEHGAIDNVFTQYYTVLTSARAKQLAKTK